jgi:hypothetical protein
MTDDNNREEKPYNYKEKQYNNSKYSDVLDMDLKERLYYMFNSFNLVLQWDIVLDEFMLHTYPGFTPKQRFLYREIVQTIRDLEFGVAPYDEVVVRIYVPRKNNPINDPFHNNPFLDEKPKKVLDSHAADFREKSGELFEKGEDKDVEDAVNELCEIGIITSEITTFNLYNKDGKLKSSTPDRILRIRDVDKENAMQAMTEVVNSNFTAYFPDVTHYKINSNRQVEDSRN